MNYQKELEKVCSELNFSPEIKFRYSPTSGYFTIKGMIGTTEVVLRLSPVTDRGKKDKALREKLASDLAGEKLVAKIIDMGESANFIWSVRRFYPEKCLSVETRSENLFHNDDIIRNEFINDPERIIGDVISKLRAIQSLSVPAVETDRIKKNKFPHNLGEIDLKLIERSIGIDVIKLQKIFEDNLNLYFQASNLRLCVGDLSPANILIKKSGVLFFDLEYFCFDHKFLDIAYLWIFLWRYSKWQSILLNESIRNDKDRLGFQFSLIRVIVGIYSEGLLGYSKNSSKAIIAQKVALYKQHICTRYLHAAIESFDSILKVNNGGK